MLLFLESYFFDEQSKFLDIRFYENKQKTLIHLRTKIEISVIRVKFPG